MIRQTVILERIRNGRMNALEWIGAFWRLLACGIVALLSTPRSMHCFLSVFADPFREMAALVDTAFARLASMRRLLTKASEACPFLLADIPITDQGAASFRIRFRSRLYTSGVHGSSGTVAGGMGLIKSYCF